MSTNANGTGSGAGSTTTSQAPQSTAVVAPKGFRSQLQLLLQGWQTALPDGSALTIDTDFFGKKRNAMKPYAGPFENPVQPGERLKLW